MLMPNDSQKAANPALHRPRRCSQEGARVFHSAQADGWHRRLAFNRYTRGIGDCTILCLTQIQRLLPLRRGPKWT